MMTHIERAFYDYRSIMFINTPQIYDSKDISITFPALKHESLEHSLCLPILEKTILLTFLCVPIVMIPHTSRGKQCKLLSKPPPLS